MIGPKHLLSAGVLLVASVAAQATDTTYTFDSITGVEQTTAGAGLTGVLVNDTAPSTVAVPLSTDTVSARCVKYFDMMLENQGIYTLSVTIRETAAVVYPGQPPQVNINLFGCVLQLKS